MRSRVWSERWEFDSVDDSAMLRCTVDVGPLLTEGLPDLDVGKGRKFAWVGLADVLRLRKGSQVRRTVRDAAAALVVLVEVTC